MKKIGDYDKIMSDRKLFSQVVYTPLAEALRLLGEREKDKELFEKVDKVLHDHRPDVLKRNQKYAILFRQIATPNYETRNFMKIAKENNLRPFFFEYLDDKFTSNNEFKRSLAQLRIKHDNKNSPAEKINIVDFNKYNGKEFKDIVTLWNEPLADFHKKLFAVYGYNVKDFDFYDASHWLKIHGDKAVNYYTNFFLLFTCYGILFENFLMSKNSEGDFSKNIVLPAIEKAMNITGFKPLIVPMEPTSSETDEYWISYDKKVKSIIPKNSYD